MEGGNLGGNGGTTDAVVEYPAVRAGGGEVGRGEVGVHGARGQLTAFTPRDPILQRRGVLWQLAVVWWLEACMRGRVGIGMNIING